MSFETMGELMQKLNKLFLSSIAFLTVSLLLTACSSGGSSEAENEAVNRSYPTTVESAAVISPSEISVAFRVTNDGTTPIEPSCKVKATDNTGTYKGVYMGIQDSIPAGVSQRLVTSFKISNEGAEFATEITAECSATTSDTESSAGQGVNVSDISECGGEDGSTWYWAPCFKVDAAPKTMMTCTADALNVDGEVVATMTYQVNTLNDGTAIGYGDGSGTQDTTAAIYKSINSLNVSCSL
jgi:hypothetical protein